jgi:hypothetical protein
LLRPWIKQGQLWPGTWCERSSKILRRDLAAARAAWIKEAPESEREAREKTDKLAYRDTQGAVFDFHSLRGQYITSLVWAGVHPKVAQRLARHSTITLTMDRYAKVDQSDLTSAVNKLP